MLNLKRDRRKRAHTRLISALSSGRRGRGKNNPLRAQYTFKNSGRKITGSVAAVEMPERCGTAANVLIATTAAIARTIAKMNLSIWCGAICSLPDAPTPRCCVYSNIAHSAVIGKGYRNAIDLDRDACRRADDACCGCHWDSRCWPGRNPASRRQTTGGVVEQRIDCNFPRNELLAHAKIDDDLQRGPTCLDAEAQRIEWRAVGR